MPLPPGTHVTWYKLRDAEERNKKLDSVIASMRAMVDREQQKSDEECRIMRLAVLELRSKNVY